jgi:TolB protein
MSFRAVGLSSKETFYVALRTADERPNWSAISNAVSVELAPVLRLTSSPEGTSATSPAWSPDGSHLAVHADWINPLHDQIFVVDLVAGEWERVTRDADFAWYPSWSPDGTRIAYMTHRHEGGPYGDDSDTGLWVQEPDLLAPRTLLARHGNGDFVRSSSWSPDGSEIAYAITLGLPPTVAGVFVVPSSGGSVRVLTNEGSGNGGPSWSPDGLSIAFHSDRSGNDEIYEVPANGGEPVPMTSDPAGDMHPAYSPDGTQIAFASDRGGSLDLWLMSTSGGGAIQLTAGDAVDTTPKWSPSGEEIAFRSNRSGGYEVWLLDVAAAVAAPR